MVATQAASLTFDESTHTYRHHNKEIPGVTTVMKKVGLTDDRWYGSDPDYRMRGTAVHTACALDDSGEYDEETSHPFVQGCVRSYRQFKADTGFKGMCWEFPMAHLELQFGGKPDVVGVCGSEYWLLDLKTGVPDGTVGIQLAGYEHLIQEGVMIPDPNSDTPGNWLTKLLFENKKVKFRKKSVYLKPDEVRGVVKSHDEVSHAIRWRAAITTYNARKEMGRL